MSNTLRNVIWIVAMLLIIWFFSSLISRETPTPKEPIKIGIMYGLTGPVASLGEQMRDGAILAVDEINKNGGINGRDIELLIEDHQFDTKTAVSAFQKLTDINKVNIIHTVGSAVALALKPLAESKKILLFADASHPKITQDSSLTLRHSNIASSDALTLAEAVAKEQPKKVGLVYINDDWGIIFRSEFEKYIKNLLPGVEIWVESHNQKEIDFRTQLIKINSFNPDAVVVSSFGPAPGLIIKQLRDLKFTGKIFANNGIVLSSDAQKILGEDGLRGIYYQSYPELPEAFKNLYQKKFSSKPEIFSMYVFTDFEILASAIKNVGPNPEKMARFIRGLGTFNGTYETVEISSQGDIIIPTIVKVWE